MVTRSPKKRKNWGNDSSSQELENHKNSGIPTRKETREAKVGKTSSKVISLKSQKY